MAGNDTKPGEISKWEALGFVSQVFVVVAIPTTGFALLGRWLDAKYHTTPYATVLGLVLAIAVSGYAVSKMAMRFSKRMKTEKPTDAAPRY